MKNPTKRKALPKRKGKGNGFDYKISSGIRVIPEPPENANDKRLKLLPSFMPRDGQSLSVMSAPKGSGKSNTCMNFVEKHFYYADELHVFSGTLEPKVKIWIAETNKKHAAYLKKKRGKLTKAQQNEEKFFEDNPESDFIKVHEDISVLPALCTHISKEKNPDKFRGIWLDDVSNDLKTYFDPKTTKHPQIIRVLDNRRQFKVFFLICQHNILDLPTKTRGSHDYLFLYQGQSDKMLKRIAQEYGILDEAQLIEAYKHATKDKYNFLWVISKGVQYRKNFDKILNFEKKEPKFD